MVLQIIKTEGNTLIEIVDKPTYFSVEYIGSNDEIVDLSNLISRTFKKYLRGEFYTLSAYEEIITFIEEEILNERFNVKKAIKAVSNIFYFIYLEETAEFGEIDSLNDDKIHQYGIDKDKSVVIQFDNRVDCENLILSMQLDIPHENNIIKKQFMEDASKLLKIKINIKSKSENIKLISLKHNKVINFGSNTTKLSSTEVCELLNISKQTLSYWRKANKIRSIKKSERVFEYNQSDIQNMMLDMLTMETLYVNKDLKPLQKVSKKSTKYEDNITEWIKTYTHKVTEQKYKKQYFFLNFGNIGITSSPQVMITDDFKLFDYINNKEIISNSEDLWLYLLDLDEQSLKPTIDTSKHIYQGYSKLYLNKLFEGRKVFN